MADHGGDQAPAAVQPVVSLAEPSALSQYFHKAVTSFLEESSDGIAVLKSVLEDPAGRESVKKFISDPQVHAFIVQKLSTKDDEDEGSDSNISYAVMTDVRFSSPKVQSVVFIKRGTSIEADKSFSSQLRFLGFTDGSPYETLHSMISDAISPFYKSYIRESGRAERDGDKMAPSVEKTMTELEMGLLHLQQNIDIPEITLTIHSAITQMIKQKAEAGTRARTSDFEDKLEDAHFLNSLQSGVNRWIKEIQKVTKLDRDPASGTALQEITFWLNLERSLNRIQEKRESLEVTLTLDILKHAKRFHALVSFDNDTGLQQALATVNDYNTLMKDFPLNDLLSATELDKIRLAIQSVFTHLRKIRNTKYPLQRALRLIEAISRDLSSQLLKVLGTRRLMHIPFEEFERVMAACFEVFATWDDEYDRLQGLMRDISKKKREEQMRMVWRSNPAHRRLQIRLDHMRKFRHQHEQLRQVIVRVLRPAPSRVAQSEETTAESNVVDGQVKHSEKTSGKDQPLLDASDANAIEDVNLAYEIVKEVDCLDVTKEGTDAWEAAIKRYDERIDRVETRITARLRDLLGTAKNANEMFRYFSRFNALFVRPHIRGAIREYQTQLIQRVKDDIEALHSKFKVQYLSSEAYYLTKLRDIPPTAGSIIWARQIERQLNTYLRRVEDVLGKGWEHHRDGQLLKADGESFKSKLNTTELFEDWARKVVQKQIQVFGRIFNIEPIRARIANKDGETQTVTVLKLKVNFQLEVITLAKEVRNMKWLGFRVPLPIVNRAHQTNQLYPFAISLIESVRTYESTCNKIEEHQRQNIGLLCAGLRREVQMLIVEGIYVVWESYRLSSFVQRFAEVVLQFQEKVDDLLQTTREIDLHVKSLETCVYSKEVLEEIIGKIQKAVDELNLHQYSNLPQWVARLDEEVERRLVVRLEAGKIQKAVDELNLHQYSNLPQWVARLDEEVERRLVVRLEAGIREWTRVLRGEKQELEEDDTHASQQSKNPLGGEPRLKMIVHELRITNQQMHLHPSIEVAQQELLLSLGAWEGIVLNLPRIQHSRYQVTPVNSVKRSQLVEIRALGAPPPPVRLAIEAVCTMLGETSMDWKELRSCLLRDNFIPSIVNFNVEQITDSIRDTMKKKYLSNPDYNFEKVSRASSACGPMVKWAIAQIQYADILKNVEPLRNELRSLEAAATKNKEEAKNVESTIESLERSIAKYKEEYAVLISQAQAIKADLATVEAKVERSVALIKSLSSERVRWDSGAETFKAQMATLIGDCLLSSAFMAYGGFFDQHLRASLLATWCQHLKAVDIHFRNDLALVEDMQPHYIYSPRELSRWVRGIHEALKPLDSLSVEGLVRIWAHEALRLFQDRLIEETERQWTDAHVDEIAMQFFPSIDKEAALKRPILFSNWLTKDYCSVDQEALRDYVKARLKVFYEEELDVPLVLFNQVLDHALRIDRVFRQPQGHLLLIGISGAGKTTLSRFVSWINGLSVFQVKVHNKYTAEDFDDDLRNVLRRAGCKGEKITFIMDESNVLDSSFLERINTLLANGEVPGLFEGDEFAALMTQCKEGAAREGLMVDSNEELYKWFTNQICTNLHVVFTMNPSEDGLKDRASTSPALFNRCVLNWFGDWSVEAYYQVGKEFTSKTDMERPDYKVPDIIPSVSEHLLPEFPAFREMVANAFVFVHQTLHRANARLQKRGGRSMWVTPRHFLDFIAHFVKLVAEKRSDLEEQQLHLQIGLQKIKETVEQVEVMQKSLTEKRRELEQMNEAANAKLKQMVQDQQEAEKRKTMSQRLQEELASQDVFINEKRSLVMSELSQVEPAVNDAKQAVNSVKRSQLVEIRALGAPPPPVRLAIEAVCTMLGETSMDWKELRSCLLRDNFIPSIVNFNVEQITDSIRDTMKKKYLSNPDYNFEKVSRASSACGPMVKWAIAQIQYADILKNVEPLRNELRSLEAAATKNKEEAKNVESTIESLERSIAKYKEEYAVLISQAQAIKADLATVEAKVERSVALIKSLSSERVRWDSGAETFKAQMATLIGDCLLSSAFMAYGGFFDQHLRASLLATWCQHLKAVDIHFRNDLALVEYLSNPDERLRWQANELPNDELCVENAIMLRRFNRYPLIIDPSGQATEFLLNEYKSKKIMKTSFLDDAFRKTLESALRFGTPLLVQDVESYDSILNPVLNREVRRTGGRTLITIGDQDIDLSPTFLIFLSTRDPSVEFPPDVCSRVTFVNFTVTRGSLQTQCLNAVLKSERPDVDAKRSDLLKMQGEFQLRLRHLEKDLLQSLNEAEGNLLDDDKIITRLETLKQEAGEVAKKVEETDVIMSEVETVSQQYASLAQSCSGIYFTLEAMNQVHFLYQYSLQFLLDVFTCVLTQNARLKDVRDCAQRLKIITKDLFQVTYNRVSRGMLHNDQITFALLLTRIFLKGQATNPKLSLEPEFDCFLRGQETLSKESGTERPDTGDKERSVIVAKLKSKFAPFKNLDKAIVQKQAEFNTWINSNEVPVLWEAPTEATQPSWFTVVQTSMYNLLLIQAFRSDRLLASAHRFVAATFGDSFMEEARGHLDLLTIVEQEIHASMPILLCAVQGFDPSGRVEDIASEHHKQLTNIAIGSAEGFSQADKAINSAAKNGKWVLLKNVHLAPGWLVQLEKKLHSVQPHPNFRLFLTMEINPKLPVNLLRAGRAFVFEPPPGIKHDFQLVSNVDGQSGKHISIPESSTREDLLAWIHKLPDVQTPSWLGLPNNAEKVLLTNLGHEMTGNLLKMQEAITGDESLVSGAFDRKKSSVVSDSRPAWMRQLLSSASTWLSLLPKNVKPLTRTIDNLRDPLYRFFEREVNSGVNLLTCVRQDLEIVIAVSHEMTGNLLKMQEAITGDESLVSGAFDRKKSSVVSDSRPAWMRQLLSSASTWLSLLPKNVKPLTRTIDNLRDPLYRFFEREVNSGVNLLTCVRQDLEIVIAVCSGERKPTNRHRLLMSDLVKGLIPADWRRYIVPKGMTVIQWINDFVMRTKQLIAVSETASAGGIAALKEIQVWLGGLFMPEAYITATRQFVAQSNGWALEELYLDVQLLLPGSAKQAPSIGSGTFIVRDLCLMGAEPVNESTLRLSDAISLELPLTILKWIRLSTEERTERFLEKEGTVRLPVYMNGARTSVLFTLQLATKEPSNRFYERGVALLASPLA
ncbi:hypothetical protein AHF37_00288 [Paragonimus kellicotti]|nr:hypothetical protein AHF37_00288 [Paragonimus kellicotti]